MSNWIKWNEKPPEKYESVLISDSDGDIYIGYIDIYNNVYINCRCKEGSSPQNAKFWMPLPNPAEVK